MSNYTARYGHNDNDMPGRITIQADSGEDAIAQAKAFVEAGQRNGTWISVTLSDTEVAGYRNVNGRAIGGIEHYDLSAG